MKKLTIAVLVLAIITSVVLAIAQQSGDYITIKKSDLPSDVLKKIQTAQARATENPTTTNKGRWFFLMSGAAGGFSTNVFIVAGPFKNQADCNELNTWAKGKNATVSRCWYSGD